MMVPAKRAWWMPSLKKCEIDKALCESGWMILPNEMGGYLFAGDPEGIF